MDRPCSVRISAGVTACDSPEMSLQSGEIPPQLARPRQWAMDSRASHDTHRAARSTRLTAPPAPILTEHGPVVPKATVQGVAAMASDGAGAVVRAGSVVAPVLLGDGPGTVHYPDSGGIESPQTDTGVRYLPRRQTLAARVSIRTRTLVGCASGPVRGDRSFHRPSRPEDGTRSGDRRDVSLSPVPASHIARPNRDACDNAPSRIRRLCVAQACP
jgi:hypothetical protein